MGASAGGRNRNLARFGSSGVFMVGDGGNIGLMERGRRSDRTWAGLSVPIKYVAAATGALEVATQLTTYTVCVEVGHCPKLPHLPTISNTWDNAPGNYISRFVVSIVSLLFVSRAVPRSSPTREDGLPFALHTPLG